MAGKSRKADILPWDFQEPYNGEGIIRNRNRLAKNDEICNFAGLIDAISNDKTKPLAVKKSDILDTDYHGGNND